MISILEAELKKPIVNSNQATIWACLKSLEDKLGGLRRVERLGALAHR